VTLHPLASHFDAIADSYDRGRPDYAPAVIGAIAAELGLAPGALVLDLAAGTGKLTRPLLAGGFEVVAVEPQPQLRELLASSIGNERALEGLAERIPLAESSVEAVTVGEAFHWFDQAAALAEIRRVLRPDGGIAVLSTYVEWGAASWAHEVGTLIAELRPEHPRTDGPPWSDAVRAAAAEGWTEPREIRVTTSRPSDPQRMLDYIGSFSWIAALPERQRTETLAQIEQLIAAGDTPPEVQIMVTIGLSSLA
jgi:ubiquinone/menaquinone biosynthesis C-methylase UbiE